MVHALRVLLRLASGRASDPTAAVLDSRTLTIRPGAATTSDVMVPRQGGLEGACGDRLAWAPARAARHATGQDPAQVEELAGTMQETTGRRVELAYVDRDYSGLAPRLAAFGLRWSSTRERSFAWVARFRHLAKDYERSPAIVAGLHFVAFVCLFLHRAIAALGLSS
jgi:hypothetical protein